MTFDLKAPKGTVTEDIDVISNINSAVKELDKYNPFPD